jgi:hypothetical protein
MTNPTNTGEIACPQCGAVNANWDANCWLCKQPLSGGGVGGDSVILAQAVEVQPQFGLSTLLLVVTVICICLGLIAIAPGLIVPLVIIVVPALVRTAVANRVSGRPTSVGDKVAAFSASLGIIVLIWLAGLVAFCTACTLIVLGGATLSFNDNIVGMLILLGIGSALGAFALMIWLLYKSWPRNNKPK